MLRIKREKWEEFKSRANEFGFYYTGNYNRGEQWTKKITDSAFREIRILGWGYQGEIVYGFPYMDIEYPPIEQFIENLITQNFVERVIRR